MEGFVTLLRNADTSKLECGHRSAQCCTLKQVTDATCSRANRDSVIIFHPITTCAPSVLQLHRDFLRNGADVMQAFNFHANDSKMSHSELRRGHALPSVGKSQQNILKSTHYNKFSPSRREKLTWQPFDWRSRWQTKVIVWSVSRSMSQLRIREERARRT